MARMGIEQKQTKRTKSGGKNHEKHEPHENVPCTARSGAWPGRRIDPRSLLKLWRADKVSFLLSGGLILGSDLLRFGQIWSDRCARQGRGVGTVADFW